MTVRRTLNNALYFLHSSHIRRLLLLCLTITVMWQAVQAQDTLTNRGDTSNVRKHSPAKASIFSAVIPGLGQVYNKKYWKIPIIYAGFGVFAYFINQNSTEYHKFKEAYIWKVSNDTVPIDNPYIYKYPSVDQLKSGKDYYERNLEISWILCGVWYILNILDASVDAHLMNFDVSDNLSLHIEPHIDHSNLYARPGGAGLSLTMTFK